MNTIERGTIQDEKEARRRDGEDVEKAVSTDGTGIDGGPGEILRVA